MKQNIQILAVEFKNWKGDDLFTFFMNGPDQISPPPTNQKFRREWGRNIYIFSPEEILIREEKFKEHFQLVEKHKFYRILNSNIAFKDAFKWTESAKAPEEYRTYEGKLKLLRCVTIASARI